MRGNATAAWVSTFLIERRNANCSRLQGMIYERMDRVRRVLQEVGGEPGELVVLVGPARGKGVAISAVSLDTACDAFPIFEKSLRAPTAPGQVRIFAWDHHGFASVRRIELTEAPVVADLELEGDLE